MSNDEKIVELDLTALIRIFAFLETLDRDGDDRKLPPEDCTIMNQWAESETERVFNFLETLDDDDGTKLADILGWSSAAALRGFVLTGKLPHEKTH